MTDKRENKKGFATTTNQTQSPKANTANNAVIADIVHENLHKRQLIHQNEEKFIYSHGRNLNEKRWNMCASTFSDFVETMQIWHELDYTAAEFEKLDPEEKENAKYWAAYCAARMDEAGERNSAHVNGCTALVYDVDDISKRRFNRLAKLIDKSGLNYVLHSTASYDSYSNYSCRLIVPFSEPINWDNYEGAAAAFWKALKMPFNIVNSACFSPACAYYYPQHLKDVKPLFFARFDGEMLAPDSLERVDLEENTSQIVSASNLRDTELPEINYFVIGVLPEGIGWLAGDPKVGKSFLALQMAHSIASGTPFLGHETKRAPVLYYSLEMAAQLIQARLNLMYPYTESPDTLYFAYELPTFDNGLIERLEADISYTGAKVLFIDTYVYVEKEKSIQKSEYGQSTKEIGQLRAFAEKHGIAIVMITHLNKNTMGRDIHGRMMGSVGNRGATDYNMALAKHEETQGQFIFSEENRKGRNIDFVLRRLEPSPLFEKVGTVDELDAFREREEYVQNPLVQLICQILLSKTEFSATAKTLFESLPEWAQENKTPHSIGHQLKRLAFRLKKYDQITFEKIRETSGQVYHFERPNGKISFLCMKKIS